MLLTSRNGGILACREALVEKRIARREDARAREASPDVAVIPGGGDMYGGDDSFAAARSRWFSVNAMGRFRGVRRGFAMVANQLVHPPSGSQ